MTDNAGAEISSEEVGAGWGGLLIILLPLIQTSHQVTHDCLHITQNARSRSPPLCLHS
jgi:hypothetical protein